MTKRYEGLSTLTSRQTGTQTKTLKALNLTRSIGKGHGHGWIYLTISKHHLEL